MILTCSVLRWDGDFGFGDLRLARRFGDDLLDGPAPPALQREVDAGAGLWMVTWTVERSGGELSFDSSSEWTTVTIRLPRGDGATPGQSDGIARSARVESPSDTTT